MSTQAGACVGLSTRNYSQAVRSFAESYGIKKSAVSDHFVRVSREKLRELLERPPPWETFAKLPQAAGYLKPGQTIEALDRIAQTESDTAATRRMQQAKSKLFASFASANPPRRATGEGLWK